MLTTAQKTILKAAIAAELDPVFVALRQEGGTGQMAEWFNQPSAVAVWRTFVPKDEITSNGFLWDRLGAMTVGQARIWDGLFDNASRAMNPSKTNVRDGVGKAWSGAVEAAQRAAIYSHCKRLATRAEKLFATGLGTDVAPSIMGFEGQITDHDVVRAINN